ncbi:P-type conjugative transfer protein TrbG [Paludibaculum fermentans]|uniref:P-type conjugative transfer protein TrbG n=1 Tax=Paludibaculum fermentans TaxID=1473598 RepID=UPI003EBDB4DA
MRALIISAFAIGTAVVVVGQQNSGPPVQAKRLPPGKTTTSGSPGNQTYLDRYDFGAQLFALQSHEATNQGAGPMSPSPAPVDSIVPPGFKPKTDVPLTRTAQDAVQISEKWLTEHNEPTVGRDGRVLYSYGAGLPTVVCAPLRVCMIELQAGEKLVGEPHIGDSVRWNLSPATYGSGASITSVIVLKPQSPGLDTNLLITTDRRAYYLRLLSKSDDYVARVAFAYPDDGENEKRWQQHLAEQKNQVTAATRIAELPPNAVDSMYFNYQLKGGDETIRPIRVFDDGKKTYIQISQAVKNREAPVLVVIGPDRKAEMVNYRVKDDMYIVDRLFERAQLILGSGKKARKVEIHRERKG